MRKVLTKLVPCKLDDITALATAAAVPDLLFGIDAEPIPATADRAGTGVFIFGDLLELAEAQRRFENVSAPRALDPLVRNAHGISGRQPT